jgi:hypothetical protein
MLAEPPIKKSVEWKVLFIVIVLCFLVRKPIKQSRFEMLADFPIKSVEWKVVIYVVIVSLCFST